MASDFFGSAAVMEVAAGLKALHGTESHGSKIRDLEPLD